MNKIISAVFVLLLSFVAIHAQAQNRPVFPDENELKVKEDYPKYEPLVISAAEWLVETDIDKQTDIRQATNIFILRWTTGSPNVSIVIEKPHMKLLDNNPPLIPVYLANYASYCISHQSYKDQIEPTKSALIAISKVYKKGIGVNKNKALEKLAEVIERQQLDEYVNKNMKPAQK
ncbi:hypothetical protein [Chitinophaga flava]|uniref:Uncharacterized protein n=1 Tax=Chitinophaga flava TaxID=2259036 RepID=A0A365Y0C2_9BACT|nr:hypothetical protein [Chitinophaga flava]RBL92056.1 hypothetical protein DF182_05535 [Chitinophaga flava]